MIEQIEIRHNIQKHILGVLLRQRTARFSEMRPSRTDSNLYSYHLNQLLKGGLVTKTEGGYTLDAAGLVYADRLNADKLFVRPQPKIVTMLVVQNSEGDVLLYKRNKQPYIDKWTLPHGKIHIDDPSLLAAAQREAVDKLGLENQNMRHVGDCYIRVQNEDTLMTVTLAHVFVFNRDDVKMTDRLRWVDPRKLHQMELAPAAAEVIARVFFNDPFFFEEYVCTL